MKTIKVFLTIFLLLLCFTACQTDQIDQTVDDELKLKTGKIELEKGYTINYQYYKVYDSSVLQNKFDEEPNPMPAQEGVCEYNTTEMYTMFGQYYYHDKERNQTYWVDKETAISVCNELEGFYANRKINK